jgi:PAS domain S-box-containing protein
VERRVVERIAPLGSSEESRFRLAIEASPTGILMVDQQGRIVLVNARIEKLFGYPRSELIGQPVEQLLPLRSRGKTCAFRSLPRGGDDLELYGLHQSGDEFPIEIGSNPLDTEEGRFVLSSVVDITERRRAEDALLEQGAELERSNRELEQFAYAASHDLREPLRMVATYVTLLEREYGDKLDGEAHEYIRFAAEGATRLARLVSDLLDYSRIGPKTLAFEPVDCRAALTEVLSGLRASIEQNEAQVVSQALPSVLGDYSLLCQLFQNLIENGIKFRSKQPPRLSISAERVEHEWHFHVADNGLGIESRFHERIFELFQRLHTRDQYPGTGMGLALCKKVVERHGGRMWVESNLGEGSVFSFSLPALRDPLKACS